MAAATVPLLLVDGVRAADRACDEFYARLPNVSWALCQAAGLQVSEGRSVKGRMIYTRDVQPATARV